MHSFWQRVVQTYRPLYLHGLWKEGRRQWTSSEPSRPLTAQPESPAESRRAPQRARTRIILQPRSKS